MVAYGVGTAAEDGAEAGALAALTAPVALGARRIPVTALRSQTGYLGAGTAAAELGLGLLYARQGSFRP